MPTIDLNAVPKDDLQPGRYVAQVEDLELVDGHKAPQLLVRLRLIEHSGRGVTDYLSLSEKALWRLRQLMVAFDGPMAFDAEELSPLRDALTGKLGLVYLALQDDGPSAGFLRVRRYAPLSPRDRERLDREQTDAPF